MSFMPLKDRTPDECKSYFDHLIRNSREQWKVAQGLAQLGNYGMATSHLLISVEESIKAVIMHMDAQGFNLRKVEGVDWIFRNHRIRFFLAYIAFVFGVIGKDVVKLIERLRRNPQLLHDFVEELNDETDLPVSVRWYILRKIALFKAEKEIFEKADLLRQIGFYADFNEGVSSPQDMSEEAYELILERMDLVRSVCEDIVFSYSSNDESIVKALESSRRLFSSKNIYSLLERGLKRAKSTKHGPFDLLK
jgi:AbiV family abortive infection protein